MELLFLLLPTNRLSSRIQVGCVDNWFKITRSIQDIKSLCKKYAKPKWSDPILTFVKNNILGSGHMCLQKKSFWKNNLEIQENLIKFYCKLSFSQSTQSSLTYICRKANNEKANLLSLQSFMINSTNEQGFSLVRFTFLTVLNIYVIILKASN